MDLLADVDAERQPDPNLEPNRDLFAYGECDADSHSELSPDGLGNADTDGAGPDRHVFRSADQSGWVYFLL